MIQLRQSHTTTSQWLVTSDNISATTKWCRVPPPQAEWHMASDPLNRVNMNRKLALPILKGTINNRVSHKLKAEVLQLRTDLSVTRQLFRRH